MKLSRRSLLIAASLSAAPAPAWAQNQFSAGRFTHGVASGDPLQTRVILWTRFAPGQGDGRIGWEISEQEDFSRIARRGAVSANAADDYCAKVDVQGLRAGRIYFYRFLSASGPSPTGVTRTAPAGGTGALTFAFFSCANKQFGYFQAYRHAAARADIDLALHLGDYIYEYAVGVYPSAAEAVAGRWIEPATEASSYAQYCARYASYNDDPDLQELRRLKPLSVIWDDHELANNAYIAGAQNHQPAEGSWAARVAAASKAFFDWMPIRRPEENGASIRIYRSLDWGDLARILLLDTRFVGRPEELNYDRVVAAAAQGPAAAMQAVGEIRQQIDDPARTRMGMTQEAWFAREMAGSKARGHAWQVVAQQVVIGRQIVPQGISRLLAPDVSAGTRRYVSGGEQLGALGLPWNLDAWDGYAAGRERLLETCVAQGTNVIALSGDSHNCWVNNLAAEGAEERNALIEFAGGSVTSAGIESALTNAQPGEREAMMRGGNPNLAFCDATHRGYGAVKLTRVGCEAEWVAFEDVRQTGDTPALVTKLSSQTTARSGPTNWIVGG